MTWVAILAFLWTFLRVLYFDAKEKNLDYIRFIKFLPLYVLIIYFFATYTYYLINNNIFIPLSAEQLILYLTPYQYRFHIIWIALWVIIWWSQFVNRQQTHDRIKWINAFLHALCRSLIPLGIFLVLWDTFIWVPTDSGFYISAIRNDSNVAVYDKVIPLWLLISVLWLLWWWILYVFKDRFRKNHWMYGLAIIAWCLALILILQQYPKRIVMWVWWVTIDINQYFFIILWIGLIINWLRFSKEK